MKITEFNPERDQITFKKYISANDFISIVAATVSPLFLVDNKPANILNKPNKKEQYYGVYKTIYYTVALIKYLTDIEIDEDMDITEAYDLIMSKGIYQMFHNNIFSDLCDDVIILDVQVRELEKTIDSLISERLAMMKK